MRQGFRVLGLIGLLEFGVLAGCAAVAPDSTSSGPPIGSIPSAPTSATVRTVYLVRRGWHIDIAFDVGDLEPALAAVARRLGAPRYLVIGFGDRHYLQAPNAGVADALEALWPGDGLMLATGLTATPAAAFGQANIVTLRVGSDRSSALQRYVRASFAGELEHPVGPLAPGPYPGSLYFAATPRYSAVHTCNTWVAESLRAAGLPIRAAGVAFAGQLWPQALRLQAQPSSP